MVLTSRCIDQSIDQLNEFKQYFLSDLHALKNDVKTRLASQNSSNNLLEAISQCVSWMDSYCQHRKYIKTILVATNNRGLFLDSQSKSSQNEIDHIRLQVEKQGIRLSIIGVDYNDSESDVKHSPVEGEKLKDFETRESNEQILQNLVDNLPSSALVSADYANKMAHSIESKKVSSTRKFWGRLTLGNIGVYQDVLDLEIEAYHCAVHTGAPTASSVCVNDTEKKAIEKEVQVEEERWEKTGQINATVPKLLENSHIDEKKLPSQKYLCSVERSFDQFIKDEESGKETLVSFESSTTDEEPLVLKPEQTSFSLSDSNGLKSQITTITTFTQQKSIGYKLGKEVRTIPQPDAEVLLNIQNGPDPHSRLNIINDDGTFKENSFGKNRFLEIIGFVPAEMVPRWFAISPALYIVANKNVPQSVYGISALARALLLEGKYAVARLNATSGGNPGTGGSKPASRSNNVNGVEPPAHILKGNPEMRLLVPHIDENFECLVSVQLPYEDDVNYLQLPHLGFLVEKEENEQNNSINSMMSIRQESFKRNNGEPLYPRKKPRLAFSHDTLLPTDKQQEAMDSLVDSMDLMEAGEIFEDKATEWGVSEDIRNPVIWRIKEVIKSCGIGEPGQTVHDYFFHEEAAIKNILKEKLLDEKHENIKPKNEYEKDNGIQASPKPKDKSKQRFTIMDDRDNIPPVTQDILKFSVPPVDALDESATVEMLFGTEKGETKEERRERLAKLKEDAKEVNRVSKEPLDIEELLNGGPERNTTKQSGIVKLENSTVNSNMETKEAEANIPATITEKSVSVSTKEISSVESTIAEKVGQILETAFKQINPKLTFKNPTVANDIYLTKQDVEDLLFALDQGYCYISSFCEMVNNSKNSIDTTLVDQIKAGLSLLNQGALFLQDAFQATFEKQHSLYSLAEASGKDGQQEVTKQFGDFFQSNDQENINQYTAQLFDWVKTNMKDL